MTEESSASEKKEGEEEETKSIPFDRPYHSEHIDFAALSSPEDSLEVLDLIGEGTTSSVYAAHVKETGRKVAVKIIQNIEKHIKTIEAEYVVLSSWGDHFYLPDFLGVFLKIADKMEEDEFWIVMELCTGGTASQLVECLKNNNRNLTEMQIAYILKEALQALTALHENESIHRDFRASNLLLTETGDIRLIDFGLTYQPGSKLDTKTRVGSPYWMAPEVVICARDNTEYDSRCDVWSLGITTIELADGYPPNYDCDPLRTMTLTARNPPPLSSLDEYSATFKDFVTECLTVYYDYRPYAIELLDHPFITQLPKNDSHIATELSILCKEYREKEQFYRADNPIVIGETLIVNKTDEPQPLSPEDVACLDDINPDAFINLLMERFNRGQVYTYVGETLLFVKPNNSEDVYSEEYQIKYQEKSLTDNPAHLYAIADRAYQDMMHQKKLQTIVILGESGSGKSTSAEYLYRQLIYLGSNIKAGINEKLFCILPVLKAFGNCCTSANPDSTRYNSHLELTFSNMGKATSAIINAYLLQTELVVKHEESSSNYHIFYYVYEGLRWEGKLREYGLSEEGSEVHRYLGNVYSENCVEMYLQLKQCLQLLTFTDMEIITIFDCIMAIILLGDVEFMQVGNIVKVVNRDVVEQIAVLLGIKEYHLRRMLTSPENAGGSSFDYTVAISERARDCLSRLIYSRLFDWIVNTINLYSSFSRIVYGDVYSVGIADFSGFENTESNDARQLWKNLCSEQSYYFYTQCTFAWEQEECRTEGVVLPKIQFKDNNQLLDSFLSRSDGILQALHLACRQDRNLKDVLSVVNKEQIKVEDGNVIRVAHTNADAVYDLSEVVKNSKALSLEAVPTLAGSRISLIKEMFSAPLSKTGQLKLKRLNDKSRHHCKDKRTNSQDNERGAENYISQELLVNQLQILTVRQNLAALMRHLAEGVPHFVFCVHSHRDRRQHEFDKEEVGRQLRAFNLVELGMLRLRGFSHRIPFNDFLERYKYLTFDFDERVDVTADNCRLLLLRLKLDGWHIGKSKVFLKYYHVEYLSRLYEIQVRKIVKVQATMRRFLALCKRKREIRENDFKRTEQLEAEEVDQPEEIHQKEETEKSEKESKEFEAICTEDNNNISDIPVPHRAAMIIQHFYKRWRLRSIFQVLQKYRMARANDLICFSQQVHIYNQEAHMCFRRSQHPVGQDLNPITYSEFEVYCHSLPSSVMKMKLPLRLENVGFEDTSYMTGPSRFYYRPTIAEELLDVAEDWDAALRRIVHTREVEAMQTTIEESDKETDESEVNEVEISDIKDEVSSNANESVVVYESEQPIIDVSNNESPTKSGSDLICDKESIMEKYELIPGLFISGESVEL